MDENEMSAESAEGLALAFMEVVRIHEKTPEALRQSLDVRAHIIFIAAGMFLVHLCLDARMSREKTEEFIGDVYDAFEKQRKQRNDDDEVRG